MCEHYYAASPFQQRCACFLHGTEKKHVERHSTFRVPLLFFSSRERAGVDIPFCIVLDDLKFLFSFYIVF